MSVLKKIVFTVTNDLNFDQRMHRICGSLSENGYDVTLVGRRLPHSPALTNKPWKQKRLTCWFKRGKWFYAEYNIRLFIWLLFRRMDAVCAIDLDTIMPCYWSSYFKRTIRIYDAHELFTELKEVISRPRVQRAWMKIEKKYLPRFKYGYTVSEGIAEEFRNRYGVNYATIRNMPVKEPINPSWVPDQFILYQGAVNEGRCFEQLIPAMQHIHSRLVICGDGNFMPQLHQLINQYHVQDKVECLGMQTPEELKKITGRARLGIALAVKEGLNQWLALPNKFFDYMHAGVPQVTMDYPEYRRINEQFEIAVLLDEPDPVKIADAVNHLLENDVLHHRLAGNCLQAREIYNWQAEEKKLIAYYQQIFKH